MALSSTAKLARELTTFIHSKPFHKNERKALNSTLHLLIHMMSAREKSGYWDWMGQHLKQVYDRPPIGAKEPRKGLR